MKKNRIHLDTVAKGKVWPSLNEFAAMIITFGFTTFAWIFFRAESMNHAFQYISNIFSLSLFTIPDIEGAGSLLVLIILFILLEWRGREEEYAISSLGAKSSRTFRWSMYMLLIITIDIFGNTSADIEFIYFQF